MPVDSARVVRKREFKRRCEPFLSLFEKRINPDAMQAESRINSALRKTLAPACPFWMCTCAKSHMYWVQPVEALFVRQLNLAYLMES
jgi:hypothetical protein